MSSGCPPNEVGGVPGGSRAELKLPHDPWFSRLQSPLVMLQNVAVWLLKQNVEISTVIVTAGSC